MPDTANVQTLRTDALRWSRSIAVQRYARLLRRLAGMTPAEIAARVAGSMLGRRLARSERSRLRGRAWREFLTALVTRHASDLREGLGRRCDERFLFGPSHKEECRRMLRSETALAVDRVLALAERALEGEVEVLSQVARIQPGDIDWQADPRTGRRQWTSQSLNEGTAIAAGEDVKYVWELNRQQYLTWLGRAYWLTDDPRYAERAAGLIDDWIRANPFGCGVNWSSHLEVAMRAMSWLWTLPYLVTWDGLDHSFLRRWLQSFSDHYVHLRSNLSVFTDPTNHLIGETTGLWMLATVFPELPDAALQRTRAAAILAGEIDRQFSRDGVNREQATSYHRFVLDFMLQVIALSRRLGEASPAGLEDRAYKALAFAAALAGESGDAPMIGDSDDARGVPLPELVGWDFRDLLSTGAIMFDRPEWRGPAGGLAEATVWLLGARAVEPFRASPAAAPTRRSIVFDEGGYCFFKGSAPGLSVDAVVDVGPLGLWPNAAHGHADALSVQLRVNGRWLLADPGTGTYFSDSGIRNRLRSTAAHNTLTIDDLDQADMLDVFKWVSPLKVELLASFLGERFDYAVARHDGYHRLRRPVTHTRHVIFVKPSRLIVVDGLDGHGEHLITRRFHVPPGVRVQKRTPGSVTVVDDAGGIGLAVTFLDGAAAQADASDAGLWSARYGQWMPAPCVTQRVHASLPYALCACIDIIPGGAAPARYATVRPEVGPERVSAAGGFLWRSAGPGGEEDLILMNPTSARVPLPDGTATDAALLYRSRRAGRPDVSSFVVDTRTGRNGADRSLSCREASCPAST